jgi:hypothetical protein
MSVVGQYRTSQSRKTATRRSFRNLIVCFRLRGGLLLPSPPEQTQCAEAGSEEWKRSGKWEVVHAEVRSNELGFTADAREFKEHFPQAEVDVIVLNFVNRVPTEFDVKVAVRPKLQWICWSRVRPDENDIGGLIVKLAADLKQRTKSDISYGVRRFWISVPDIKKPNVTGGVLEGLEGVGVLTKSERQRLSGVRDDDQ